MWIFNSVQKYAKLYILVSNETVLKHVTQLIEKFYKRPITQINKDQALLPSKCIILENKERKELCTH